MRFKESIFVFAVCVPFNFMASAADFNWDHYGDNLVLGENTFVAENVNVSYDVIDVNSSIVINNSGVIENLYGDTTVVNVCAGCDLYIQNKGVFEADFVLQDGATLTQVIRSDADITNLGIGGSFAVLVDNAQNISLSSILRLGSDKIILDNSGLLLDLNSAPSFRIAYKQPDIELRGDITIYLDSVKDLNGKPLLSNVDTTDGSLYIVADDLDILHAITTYIKDGNLYADLIRETDYFKIFQNPLGKFLNDYRKSYPDSKLLGALDKADSVPDLFAVMDRSVVLNPRLLLKPLRSINALDSLSFGYQEGMIASPDFVLSDDFYSVGGQIVYSHTLSEDFNIHLGADFDSVSVADDINEYLSNTFGVQIGAGYRPISDTFINVFAKASYASFDVGEVFYNNEVINNPDALLGFSVADIGFNLYSDSVMDFSPFVGLVCNYENMLNESLLDAQGRVGILFNVSEAEVSDLRYDYSLMLVAQSDGQINAGIKGGFFSDSDGAGGAIEISAVQDEFGMSYKFALDARLLF